MKLDLYDKKILYELDKNSRIQVSKLSKIIRLPKETVKYRIDRLISNKIIKSFVAQINASKLGYTYYMVLLELNKILPETENSIIKLLKSIDIVSNIRSTEGDYAICFLCVCKRPVELIKIFERLNSKHDSPIKFRSINIVFSSYKIYQKIFYRGKEDKMLIEHHAQDHVIIPKIEMEILKMIVRNSRIKLIEIAEKLNIKAQVARYHLKKLEKSGIISGYGIELDFENLKRPHIQLNIILRDHKAVNSIVQFFDSTSYALVAYRLIGHYDLSIELYIPNRLALTNVIEEFRNKYHNAYIDYQLSTIVQEFDNTWSPI